MASPLSAPESPASLPDRLAKVPFPDWLPNPEARTLKPQLLNAHAHHDTNPWGWDGVRMVAELWRRGVARVGVVAFDSGDYVDEIAALARYTGDPIPCFIEALALTPGEGEVWNDLPGRMYIEAGPFASSAGAAPLSDALKRLARRRAEYQAARWNDALDLGFEYQPDWEALTILGVTEANLCRDFVGAVKAHAMDPAAIWRQLPGLDANPEDANFARAFRNAATVADDAIARVPPTAEYYLSTEAFIRLSGDRALYMYVGKEAGEEADRARLLARAREVGFGGVCAVPQRNLDTYEHAADFERFLDLLAETNTFAVFGTEVNAHGQWWSLDLSRVPFSARSEWMEANLRRLYSDPPA